MLKNDDEIKQHHLAGCVRAFLEGKKTINWVMAFVKGHHLPKAILQDLLDRARPNADHARYDELLKTCRDEDLL